VKLYSNPSYSLILFAEKSSSAGGKALLQTSALAPFPLDEFLATHLHANII